MTQHTQFPHSLWVLYEGRIIGTAHLDELDDGMGAASGRFTPTPCYEAVRPVFRFVYSLQARRMFWFGDYPASEGQVVESIPATVTTKHELVDRLVQALPLPGRTVELALGDRMFDSASRVEAVSFEDSSSRDLRDVINHDPRGLLMTVLKFDRSADRSYAVSASAAAQGARAVTSRRSNAWLAVGADKDHGDLHQSDGIAAWSSWASTGARGSTWTTWSSSHNSNGDSDTTAASAPSGHRRPPTSTRSSSPSTA